MEKLTKRELFCYSLSPVGINLAALLLNSFVSSYWTDVVGISAAAAGMIFLVSRIFDGFSDLTMGFVIDKTNTRWGKAKPWIFIGGLGTAVLGVLVFSVPQIGPTARIIWATATYMLFFAVFNTMAGISTSTMVSYMTDDSSERTSLGAGFNAVQVVVMALVVVCTVSSVSALGGGQKGWTRYTVILGMISVIFLLITLGNIKERVAPKPEDIPAKVTVKSILKALVQNKYFFSITLGGLLINLGTALMTSVGVYYATWLLKDANLYTLLGIAALLPNVIGIPLSVPLIKKFGKFRCTVVALIIGSLGQLICFVNPYSIPILFVSLFLKGLGCAPFMASYYAFVADAADYGQWKTGVASQGVSFSGTSFGNKVGAGLAGAVMGGILALVGYDGLQEVQTQTALEGIKYLFILGTALPTALIIPALLPFRNLEKQMPEISQALHGNKEQDKELV
ncbi:MAG TPA: glycoside-pentoside-hexuronide (GPH):cation symporter [Clostridiales bacterium]|nr:glycoside-pentoside-hexuronide (GPH):cation symporter [Clostridiales bacterium]